MKFLTIGAFVFCAGAWAQETSSLTARELFYRDDSSPAPAARPQSKKKAAESKPPAVAAVPPGTQTKTETASTQPSAVRNTGGAAFVKAAMHLGVRYNVLLVTDRETKARKPVDPDSRFRAGDCVAIELASNRDGFLYVFNAGSTGAWQALLPSPQMPDQRNVVRNGTPMVLPSDHCFEFDNTPGSEKLLVVITEREEDQKRLSDAIRSSGDERRPPPREGGTLVAGGALMRDLEMMRTAQLIGRDIKIAKVGTPQAAGEKPHSVYAVNSAASSDQRLVIEIVLRHD